MTPAGHLHPAISGPQPPWGSETWGRGARNWPMLGETLRPLRPFLPTVKIPCSSIHTAFPPLVPRNSIMSQEIYYSQTRLAHFRAGLGPGTCRDPSLEASPETIPVFCGAMPPTPESSSQVCRVLVPVFLALCVWGLCVQISQSAGDANTSTETGSAGGGKVVYLSKGKGKGKSLFLNGLLLGSICTGIQVKLINLCQAVRIKQQVTYKEL